MPATDLIDRTTYRKTRHRGLSWRPRRDGRTYFGYIPGRGRIRLRSTTEREAVAEYGELRGRVAKGEKVASPRLRFGEVVEAWFASDECPQVTSTRKLYRAALDNELLPRLGHRKLADIDLDTLKSLIRGWKDRGLSRSTVESYLCPARGAFDYAMRRGQVNGNPCNLLRGSDLPEKAKRRAHEWTDEEIARLLAASERIGRARTSRHDYSPMLKLAVYTGLRLGEVVGLEWGDVDLGDKPVIEIRRQFTRYGEVTAPKTRNSIRRVPLWPEAVAVLHEQRKRAFASGRAQANDPLFLGRNGTRIAHRNIQRRGFTPARDAAGLPAHLRFHDLRHAFASLAAHRGVPVTFLSNVMGHANVGVTQSVYVHLYGREDAEDAFREAAVR